MTPSCSILFNIFSANPTPYVSLTLSSSSPMLLTIMGCICIHLTMPICWRGSYIQDIRDQTANDRYSALLLFVMLSIIKVRVEFVGTALLGWQVLRIKWYNESNFSSSEERVAKLISRHKKFVFLIALLDLIDLYSG